MVTIQVLAKRLLQKEGTKEVRRLMTNALAILICMPMNFASSLRTNRNSTTSWHTYGLITGLKFELR